LHLLLDSNVGFFVSYNSAGKDEVSPRSVLFDKFMERYFPGPPVNEPVVTTAAQDAKSVAGLYKISRRFETNILAFTALLDEAKVRVDHKDNTIYINDFFKNLNGQPKHFREVGPMLFRAVDGHEKIAFATDYSGRRVAYIDFPFMVFQEVNHTLDHKILNYVVLGFSLTVIVLTLVLWPVSTILRKHYGKPLALSESARRWRTLVHGACLIVLAFVLYLALLANKLETPGALGSSGDAKLHLLQVIGLVSGIGALIAVLNAVNSWTDVTQWRWYKIWNTLLAVACVGFFWFIHHWHLLNFHLNY